ncbi:RNA polymerase sigma factor [Fictibacillus aquaticus]|uniref:RNA polymerase n=1 Tax=Fictibacillus aquaticus TaxID=2021314 RepID=A0A235F8D6_9BACL|nr:RNA polymerase sigma factor [Fictibacillus aquaticus]OYD57502.1 hypothetical protein CGZ90_12560 [Fictibacillus aquaticus]
MEDQLIKRVLDGDEEAFRLLVTPYILQAKQTAYLIVHDYTLAEDAVQEALYEAFRSMHRYNPAIALFKTWFNKIVIHQAMKVTRKWSVKKWLPFFNDPEDRCTPEKLYEMKEHNKLLYEAVKKLSIKHQVVIVLHYFQEQTLKEIAATLGISEGTVKSRLFKAKEKLKNVYGEGGQDYGTALKRNV